MLNPAGKTLRNASTAAMQTGPRRLGKRPNLGIEEGLLRPPSSTLAEGKLEQEWTQMHYLPCTFERVHVQTFKKTSFVLLGYDFNDDDVDDSVTKTKLRR